MQTCVWPIMFSASLWRKVDTLGFLLLKALLYFAILQSKIPNNFHRCTTKCGAFQWSLLRCALFLREDPENELSILMGFKGRGDDDILSWRQPKTLCHLSQVNVGLAFSFGGCVQEEVLLQMLILFTHLWMERNQRKCGSWWSGNELLN